MITHAVNINMKILIILLFLSFLVFSPANVNAVDSNYACNLSALWSNEVYEKPDIVNNKIGENFGLHFVDFTIINGTIWGYYIKGNEDGKPGVGLAKSNDGVNFTDYGLVLDVGYPGAWDDGYASFPGIWYENGVWYLVYEGAGTNCDGDIGLATSTNGVNFTKQGKILTHNTSGWESRNIGTPDLYKSGNTWYLTYHGFNDTLCQIGVASGTNIYNLTKSSSNPVLVPGASGSFDYGTLGRRDVIYDNGYYYMVYEVSTEMVPGYPGYAGSKWTHAFARSSDMVNWTKLPQENLIPQTNNAFGNDGPCFLQWNGATYIYYRFVDDSLRGINFTRRARLANEINGGYSTLYEAESMYHQIGRVDGDGWSANSIQDNAGFLVYGPYTTDVPVGENVAIFKAMIDNNSADNNAVMRLEVYDVNANAVIASRDIKRRQFASTNHYEFFSLPFFNANRGHTFEFRIYWYDEAFIRVDRILVNYGNFSAGWYNSQLAHQIGRAENFDFWDQAWTASTALDNAGYLSYGPYEININNGEWKACWTLSVDNNNSDNLNIVTIDVYDYDANQVLASRTIKRQEFKRTNKYEEFTLNFTYNNPRHRIEFRTYWHDNAYVKLGGITVR